MMLHNYIFLLSILYFFKKPGENVNILCVRESIVLLYVKLILYRPPGHHAEHDKAMGFCFFNNVAIAAVYAKKKFGLSR